jgi:hypothetical protein
MVVTFVCFVVGLILVGMGITVTVHFLHRQPALAARRAAVLEITHRATRIDAARAELARTRSEMTRTERELEKLRERLAEWLQLDDAPGSAWRFFFVAGVLGLLEAILFLVYGLGSGFGNIPSWLLALIAPPAASITLVLMHVLLAAAFGSRYRPARTLARARIGLIVAILGVILGVWAVLGGRNLTDVNAIETLTAVGLISLTSVTSLAGGFSALIATTLMQEQWLERTVALLEVRHQALEEHHAAIEADLTRVEKAAAGHQSTSAGFAAPPAIVPIVFLALLIPALSKAQPVGPLTPFDRTGACEIEIDLTLSVNALARQRALAHIRENLAPMTDALGCKVIRVVPFSASLLDEVTEVPLPAVTDSDAACHNSTPARATGVERTTALLYPIVGEERAREAQAACESRISLQRQQQIMARRQALARVASALDAAATHSPRGNCTALNLAVRRALLRAQHLIVVTDGINTCPTPTANVPIGAESTLLFLIVPSKGDSPDAPEDVLGRLDVLQKAFPGSQTLLAPELTPSFWLRLSLD